MNRLGWILFGIAALALVLLFSCRGEGIDRARADELATEVARLEAADSLARARFDELDKQFADSLNNWRAREDSLNNAARRAASQATAALVNVARQHTDLRVALDEGGLCPPLCARLDSLVTGYETALAAKDAELDATRSLADGFKRQTEQLGVLLASAREALTSSDSLNLALMVDRDFWKATAERLEGGNLSLFGWRIRASCGVQAGAYMGTRGPDVGAGLDCQVSP